MYLVLLIKYLVFLIKYLVLHIKCVLSPKYCVFILEYCVLRTNSLSQKILGTMAKKLHTSKKIVHVCSRNTLGFQIFDKVLNFFGST